VTALSQWTVAGDGYVALNKTVAPTTSLIEQGAVTYTINLHNLDSITYTNTNTLLSDTLPGEVEFSGWIVQPSGAAINDGEIAWSGDVASGETITFTFVATYTGGYGDEIANTAVFSSTDVVSSTATLSILHSVYLPMITSDD
jgi:uncharacterized repeat protein (TIGR01451 family)